MFQQSQSSHQGNPNANAYGATAFGMHSGSHVGGGGGNNPNSMLSENAMISDRIRTRKLKREEQLAGQGM